MKRPRNPYTIIFTTIFITDIRVRWFPEVWQNSSFTLPHACPNLLYRGEEYHTSFSLWGGTRWTNYVMMLESGCDKRNSLSAVNLRLGWPHSSWEKEAFDAIFRGQDISSSRISYSGQPVKWFQLCLFQPFFPLSCIIIVTSSAFVPAEIAFDNFIRLW